MNRLRRSSVALAVAVSTVFAGAAVTPAVAQSSDISSSSEITHSIEGSSADLPSGSSDLDIPASSSDIVGSMSDLTDGEISGSLDNACGTTEFGDLISCALAATVGVTAALAIVGVLRTVLYEVAGI
ncbi:MAG: hypothetical protein L0J74_03200 [Corynebacterium sp.]|uniref:hypothetical protein n=1 Tax=Corynebacterium TaxID=1716 RepID=UPI0026487CF6|nr:hypothetical protein [Corynebacterium sp.]MDN5723229.1 hypothetical protein [Corynebacterium sp.]MDN6281326.1 hypothetical protein [Corynebacterium sp.]MDN6304802.1 hypothetical protein [Corynebacterium sp.]MDN6352755.1 hypothetical protein [Corynebacterium sp.]MDN6366690.1 hypothetical protein [Corynebacterium sp.]